MNDMTDIKKLIAELASDPSKLGTLEPYLFEKIIAEIMASQGYKVQVTPPTRMRGHPMLFLPD